MSAKIIISIGVRTGGYDNRLTTYTRVTEFGATERDRKQVIAVEFELRGERIDYVDVFCPLGTVLHQLTEQRQVFNEDAKKRPLFQGDPVLLNTRVLQAILQSASTTTDLTFVIGPPFWFPE